MARFESAEDRWAGVGPYYAMFPMGFADEVIGRYSCAGDWVLDPFAGRGTAIYSACRLGRRAIGCEINPLGWVYTKTKLRPACKSNVRRRLEEIGLQAKSYSSQVCHSHEFFQLCFEKSVLSFLLAARDNLNWRSSTVDRTLMAILLVYLHGKLGGAVSNQMRQTKSMAPDYCIRWWRKRGYSPPQIDAVDFFIDRIEWRYAKGRPNLVNGFAALGDCRSLLKRPQISSKLSNGSGRVKLLFTSPPYCGVTNYHYDQWLRLWLMGFPFVTNSNLSANDNRHSNRDQYKKLLIDAMMSAAGLMDDKSVVYVRTDARGFTLRTTVEVLKCVFPQKAFAYEKAPYLGPTQTRLFGDHSPKKGDVDIIMA